MKQIVIIVLCLITSVKTNIRNATSYPNLRIGENRIDIKAIYKCKGEKDHKIIFNLFMNKTSATTSVIKGNFTNSILFDDTLFINVDFDVRDTIGRWQENSLMTIIKPKACSATYSFIKKEYFHEFGAKDTCPGPMGTYIVPGIGTANIEKKFWNIPKLLIYGTYKVHISVTDANKKIQGCFILLAEVKRPWEMY